MINSAISSNIFFGISITLVAYIFALFLKQKTKLVIFNPLLVSIILVISFVTITKVKFEDYNIGANHIGYLLTPTTVCLAVPLYENLQILKHNWKAIFLGIFSGIIVSVFTVLPITILFKLSHVDYITLLPKSITGAFGMVLSKEIGGLPAVTIIVIILTGIFGSIISDYIFKIFKIKSPVAKGVALGVSAHAMGTSKAFENSELEGAVSSIALVITGIITVIIIPIFTNLH